MITESLIRSDDATPTSVSCPIRTTSPKRTRGQGWSTGNNGGIGVQSQRHLFPDLARLDGRPQRRAAGPWTDMRLLRRHAAIDHQFRAGDPG